MRRRLRAPRAGEHLHISADLRIDVTAPDGRSAQVVVGDDGGTVRVALARAGDLAVLRASLPGGLGGAVGQLVRLAHAGGLRFPPWDQHIEVVIGSAVVLRRRGGRWSPASRVGGPAAVLAVTVVVVVVAVATAGRLRRG